LPSEKCSNPVPVQATEPIFSWPRGRQLHRIDLMDVGRMGVPLTILML